MPTFSFSEACERNKDPILEHGLPFFRNAKNVLEIGSGTGQHAAYFARSCPWLVWQSSDQADYLPNLKAYLEHEQIDNISTPIEVDVRERAWLKLGQDFDLIYTANTLHIMDWEVVEHFFAGLGSVLASNGILIIYGPFKMNGEFRGQGNAQFDASLRARGVGSAIRDLEAVQELASQAALQFEENYDLPANNQCLIWKKM